MKPRWVRYTTETREECTCTARLKECNSGQVLSFTALQHFFNNLIFWYFLVKTSIFKGVTFYNKTQHTGTIHQYSNRNIENISRELENDTALLTSGTIVFPTRGVASNDDYSTNLFNSPSWLLRTIIASWIRTDEKGLRTCVAGQQSQTFQLVRVLRVMRPSEPQFVGDSCGSWYRMAEVYL